VIAIEILSNLIEDVSKYGKESSYHPRCSETQLTDHLCFADDLLSFLVATL
jgi:hypothetical protein